MKYVLFALITASVLVYSFAPSAQDEPPVEKSNESQFMFAPQADNTIDDKLELFNRMTWRIQNLNMLVNKWQSDLEYRIIPMELASFKELVDTAQKKFEPEKNKENFHKLAGNLKTLSDEMSALAQEKKHDELKSKASDLFKAYAEFKMALNEKSIEQLQ